MKTHESLTTFFQEIIESHKGILFKVANLYCKNQSDRQDLLQEMMLQIWKSLQNYNAQYKLSTWLYRIALNVAISFYRKSASRDRINKHLPEDFLLIQKDTDTTKQEQVQLLEKFISGLNEIDKALIILYLEDKSHAEIAEIAGISVTNAGTKINRIKEKLRKQFSQLNTPDYE